MASCTVCAYGDSGRQAIDSVIGPAAPPVLPQVPVCTRRHGKASSDSHNVLDAADVHLAHPRGVLLQRRRPVRGEMKHD